ncbi:Cys-Gln thioester bond-forming surface protein [Spiractinospora alimapuensis]|uniref:thioester domain-containing protein n=1 Tax=Spiractinospora alimapuensis TaxID=2820884 RepID=UPI001F2C60CA|nr:thioester domain-containing protein [Spiractinospora alimapuensis]QVQ51621.1 Cys-Gln thioester bond-forming surface protein [Spiractinospora alimapuensis]
MTTSSATRSRWGRRAFSALTASALMFGLSASPAFADPVTGEYEGNGEVGHAITMGGGSITAQIFDLKLDTGETLRTYCIDYDTPIRRTSYIEDDWANYPGRGDFEAEAGKVHWILQNSYPQVGVEELENRTDAEELTDKDALSGTQAAIWHYSNGKDLDPKEDQPNVTAVYDYLVENAQDLPQSDGEEPTLAIDPDEASGTAGEIVGAFEVSTNRSGVPLDLEGPEGLELVDLDGEPIATVDDGDTFGVLVPEDAEPGEATISGSVSESTEVGRLFKGETEETQTLITAEGDAHVAEAAATISWDGAPDDTETPPPDDDEETPPPPEDDETAPPEDDKETPPEEDEGGKPEDDNEGGLPVTGSTLTGLIIAAVVALGGGGLALYLARKRRGGLPVQG